MKTSAKSGSTRTAQQAITFQRKSGLDLTIALALGFAATAQAQTPPTAQKTEEVVVTGTSIRGVAAVGAPALSVDRAAMAAAGVSTSSEIARTLPQVINLGADESRLGGAQDGAANTTRTSGINLRGIGNEATLLLINGRRPAASGVIKSLSDPNQIPSAAVQRMEVVLDGASAIYGSDAVAGVVNIITRKNTDAIETTLRYGSADGMNQKMFSQTFGKTWDTGSVFLAYEHNDRSSLPANARPFFSNDLRPYGGTDQRSTQAAPGNIIIGAVTYPIPAGQNGVGLTAAQLSPSSATNAINRYDAGQVGDFLPSQKRDTFYANVYQNVNDRLELFYEGYYSKRKYNQRVAPLGANLNYLNTYPYYVRPAGAAAGTSETVAYRFIYDDTDLNLGGNEKNSQNAVGLNYDLGSDWFVNGYYSYGKNEGFVHRPGLTNTTLLTTALANGSLNPFSAVAASNPGFQGVVAYRNQIGINVDNAVGLKADGPIGNIGGGAVRIAVGAEVRHVDFRQSLLQNVTTPTNVPLSSQIRNNRNIKAVYSELFFPIVGSRNASPMIQRLELSVAARYEKYSDFGNTTNPKIGLLWAPNDVVTFNSTYGTSFRAPSLVDNSGTLSSLSLLNVFIQNLAVPGGTIRGIFYNGGNPDLKPEEAKTWSFGVDLKPMKGVNVSASYYKIDYENRIDVVPNTALSSAVNEALYAPYIIRNPSVALVNTFMTSPNLQNTPENPAGILAIIDGRRNNLGTLRQQGIDIDARYSFSSSIGDWMLGFNAAKILKLTRTSAPGQAFADVLDTLNNPVSLRTRTSVGWKSGNWSANAFASYITGYAISPTVSASSWTIVDASLGYDFGQGAGAGLLSGVKINLSAQNLFDRDPPVVISGTSSWDSQNATATGRFLALEVTKSW